MKSLLQMLALAMILAPRTYADVSVMAAKPEPILTVNEISQLQPAEKIDEQNQIMNFLGVYGRPGHGHDGDHRPPPHRPDPRPPHRPEPPPHRPDPRPPRPPHPPRPPQPPPYRPPHHPPHRPPLPPPYRPPYYGVICYAEDYAGYYYSGSAYDAWRAQDLAMQTCEFYSSGCEPAGCQYR